jgi:primase-polymerase (primpol)-like protein
MMDLTPYYPGYGHEEINGVTYVWEFVNRSTGMLKYGVNGEELKSVFLNDTSSEFKEYIQRIAFKESTSEQAKQDRAHRRAMDILEGKLLDENDVPITPRDFILNTFKTQHIGDIETAEGILLGTANQSIKNSKGIQTGVFGESGKGKSHAGRAMMHLHPAKYYLIESLSDKALFYMASDELRPGMTIFSDDVRISDGLEDIIKRSTSQFQDETTHRVATKENRDGKLISKKYTIPPRINWLLTSVDAQGSEQLVNRQIGFGVDESSAQDDEIIKFEALKAMEGKPEFE